MVIMRAVVGRGKASPYEVLDDGCPALHPDTLGRAQNYASAPPPFSHNSYLGAIDRGATRELPPSAGRL